MAQMAQNKRKLSVRERVVGIARVAAITYKASPLAVFVKLVGTLITSILPIVTTYFAALTTTALAEAYGGDESAGGRAITFVVVTARETNSPRRIYSPIKIPRV